MDGLMALCVICNRSIYLLIALLNEKGDRGAAHQRVKISIILMTIFKNRVQLSPLLTRPKIIKKFL